MWATPGAGTQLWVRQPPSAEGQSELPSAATLPAAGEMTDSLCPQGGSRQLTITFHYNPQTRKIMNGYGTSIKTFGLHPQATCMTLEQGEVCSQTFLTHAAIARVDMIATEGYDRHRKGEGHGGAGFTVRFPCQAHKNLQCVLRLCSFTQLPIQMGSRAENEESRWKEELWSE